MAGNTEPTKWERNVVQGRPQQEQNKVNSGGDGNAREPSTAATNRRRKPASKRKLPYLAKQSFSFPSQACDVTELLSVLNSNLCKIFPVARATILQAESKVGHCTSKAQVHHILFNLVLKEVEDHSKGEEQHISPDLLHTVHLYFDFVSDLDLTDEFVLRVCSEMPERPSTLNKLMKCLSDTNSNSVCAKLRLALKSQIGLDSGDEFEGDDKEGSSKLDRVDFLQFEMPYKNEVSKRLYSSKAVEYARTPIESWSECIKKLSESGRSDSLFFLHILKAFQSVLADTIQRNVKPAAVIRDHLFNVLEAVVASIKDIGDAMHLVESILHLDALKQLREGIRYLFTESFVERTMLSISNKAVKDEKYAALLRQILVCLIINPRKVVERLLYDGFHHESQVEAVVVQIFRDLPLTLRFRSENKQHVLALEILSSIFSEFLDGEHLAEENNLLRLIKGISGKVALSNAARGCVSMLEAQEVLHSFLLAWGGNKAVMEPACFRVLQHLVEISFRAQSCNFLSAVEDLAMVFAVLLKYWEGRSFTSEDTPNLESFLETADVVSEISNICEQALLRVESSSEVAAAIEKEIKDVLSNASWKGLLLGLRFLDPLYSQLSSSDKDLADDVYKSVSRSIHAEDSSVRLECLLIFRCILLNHKALVPSGMVERAWSKIWNDFQEWIESSSLKEVKIALNQVLSHFLPWCTPKEMEYICCSIFPQTTLQKVNKSTLFDETFLLAYLDEISASNSLVRSIFMQDLKDVTEIAVAILKLDTLESLARSLGSLANIYSGNVYYQAAHQLASCLCMLCVESVKAKRSSTITVLSWHCARILCSCIRFFGASADLCLANSLLEMTHVVFDKEFRNGYRCSGSGTPWFETEKFVGSLIEGSHPSPPPPPSMLGCPGNRDLEISLLPEFFRDSIKDQIRLLPQQLKSDVEPVIASLLSNSGQDAEGNLLKGQGSTQIESNYPDNSPPHKSLPEAERPAKQVSLGNDDVQDISKLQYEREFLLSFQSDFAKLPKALEACLYPVIVTDS